LMFLKEKRDRSIKVRGCANGKSQQEYTTKAETSSPTLSLESMMTCVIAAKEGKYIAVTNIPREFLQAEMDKDVHIISERIIAKLIVRLETKLYWKYVWKNKHSKPILHVKL